MKSQNVAMSCISIWSAMTATEYIMDNIEISTESGDVNCSFCDVDREQSNTKSSEWTNPLTILTIVMILLMAVQIGLMAL